MRKAIVALAALAALSNEASASTFVLRSSTTGAIAAPAVVQPVEPTTPDSPAGFALYIVGQTSVVAGATLDLRPVASGASGTVSYSYFGTLPLGGTFDADTGRIS